MYAQMYGNQLLHVSCTFSCIVQYMHQSLYELFEVYKEVSAEGFLVSLVEP